jgi:FkbM family methyltransferase
MELSNYKGVLYRSGNVTDLGMAREAFRNYKWFDLDQNSIVVDLGAHIGTFAKICADKGVGLYVGYEPDPDNFEVFERNLHGGVAVNSAVSWSKDPWLTFTRSQSDFGYCAGTVTLGKRKGKHPLVLYPVKNIWFGDVLERWKPTHLKIDIERAELDIIEHWVPSNIKQIAIEIHGKAGCKKFLQVHLPQWLERYDLVHQATKGSAMDMFFTLKTQ